MFLFDTDHLVILQQTTQPEYDHIVQHMSKYNPSQFYVSIISFHEQVMGWNAYISKAKDAKGVVRGYEKLQKVLKNFKNAQVLDFDDLAATMFDDLRKQKVRIGTMDLRIASIALVRDLIVLSRNQVDFGRVPGMQLEVWTIP